MEAENPVRIAWSTLSDRGRAEAIAHTLVEERLIACVNLLGGVTSVYRWEGKVERDEEILLIMKTRADRVAALRDRLLELHPYDVPEFVVLPLSDGAPAYLRWVVAETGD